MASQVLFVIGYGDNEPSHSSSVEDTPQTPENAEACPGNDRECNMEYCAWPGIQDDEGGDDTVTDPDTYPCLPPGHAELDHRRDNHPTVKQS